jgi:PD-(D/E)XK endonuclease
MNTRGQVARLNVEAQVPDRDKAPPRTVGDRSEALVMAKLLQVYATVLLPFGAGARYDLVVDDGERLLKVQVKTGRLRAGAVRFNTCSSTAHWGGRKGYAGEIDYFGVYCPDNAAVYLVPVEHVGQIEGALRVESPRNNQTNGIRWAEQYQIMPS